MRVLNVSLYKISMHIKFQLPMTMFKKGWKLDNTLKRCRNHNGFFKLEASATISVWTKLYLITLRYILCQEKFTLDSKNEFLFAKLCLGLSIPPRFISTNLCQFVFDPPYLQHRQKAFFLSEYLKADTTAFVISREDF